MIVTNVRHAAVAVAIAVALVVGGCGSDDDPSTSDVERASTETIRLWIEPDLVECDGGAGPQECLEVARAEGGDVELFYDSIEGFEFEEGTAYVIDVSVEDVDNPPADGSSVRYTLVEVVETAP